jgi:hypothetical protein
MYAGEATGVGEVPADALVDRLAQRATARRALARYRLARPDVDMKGLYPVSSSLGPKPGERLMRRTAPTRQIRGSR